MTLKGSTRRGIPKSWWQREKHEFLSKLGKDIRQGENRGEEKRKVQEFAYRKREEGD